MKHAELNKSRKLRHRLERKYIVKLVKGINEIDSDLDLIGDPP